MKNSIKYIIALVITAIIAVGIGVAITYYSICEECQECPSATASAIMGTNPQNSGKWCPNQPQQICKMNCPAPNCKEDECAERVGDCCNYTCISHSEDDPTGPDTRIVHGRPLENRITRISFI